MNLNENVKDALDDAKTVCEADDNIAWANKVYNFMKQKSNNFSSEAWKQAVDVKGVGLPMTKWEPVEKIVKAMFTGKEAIKEEDSEELDEVKGIQRNYGFDLTDIKAEKWAELVKLLGLKSTLEDTRWSQKDNPSKWWVWKGDGIVINTSNNPVTGKEANNGREDEKGYAGYIGITGDNEKVQKAVAFIKDNASDIKGESKNKRDFI